ncbi:hypothetical protein ACSDQ9_04980 [Aestuariimicrobium soli]|uniref:hypothetical protein n=1 Tax=Aestuariimicrobium soli TaxID=2035834 RepID=UPI003EB9AA68
MSRPSGPSVAGVTMLSVSVLVLAAGMFLPLAQPPNSVSRWQGGIVLSQFGPHLLNGALDQMVIYVGLFTSTFALALLLLLGLARLVGQVLWVVAIVMSSVVMLFSSLLLLGFAVAQEARTGIGAFALPLGALLTLLSACIPRVKDAWVRPGAF